MRILWFVLVGVAGGVLAGMGMGGGTLTMPLLVLALGVGQLTAQFSNLLAFLPSGAAALLCHAKNGYLKFDGTIYILIPAVAASAVAALFAARLNADVLKKLFGGFLIAIALVSFVSTTVKKIKNRYLQ